MNGTIKILLVDDHEVFRQALRYTLELEVDLEVVGEAANAKEALTQLEFLSPEIILMDIKMPGVDGIELTHQVKHKQPFCNVIMLTMYGGYLLQAMEAGASGYFFKDVKCQELVEAIRRVHRGEVVVSENITSLTRSEYEERYGESA